MPMEREEGTMIDTEDEVNEEEGSSTLSIDCDEEAIGYDERMPKGLKEGIGCMPMDGRVDWIDTTRTP